MLFTVGHVKSVIQSYLHMGLMSSNTLNMSVSREADFENQLMTEQCLFCAAE